MTKRLTLPSKHLILPVLRTFGWVIAVAVMLSPLAIAWGVGNARTEDYLGPHSAEFAVNFDGELKLNLGPVGNAYFPSAVAPIGLEVQVGGVRAAGGRTDFFADSTLAEYLSLYTDPRQAIEGITERLVLDAAIKAVVAEAVLIMAWLLWTQRQHFLSAQAVEATRPGRALAVYLTILLICLGSVIAPPERTEQQRIPISVTKGTQFDGLSVDSRLLYTLLDRGLKGAEVLAERQLEAIERYEEDATDDLIRQQLALPKAAPNESMIFAISDLHCSIAMTELWRRVVALTNPSMIISAGDDTMNGTAAERGCISREAAIAAGRPFVVAPGNHDSDVTEQQMRGAEMQVLNGEILEIDGQKLLGDDDPERNPPFSMERTNDRGETEQQFGQRMADLARGKDVDTIIVHQPAAAVMITDTPNPPGKLIIWGHMHNSDGPKVLLQDDGSWSVALQLGTAGGVKQPTFTSFSTPYSTPRTSADGYFFFRDRETGLITGYQAIHFLPDAKVVIEPRLVMGDPATLPPETRERLGGSASAPITPGRSTSPAQR